MAQVDELGAGSRHPCDVWLLVAVGIRCLGGPSDVDIIRRIPSTATDNYAAEGDSLSRGEIPQAREGAVPITEPKPEGAGRSFPPVSDRACQTMIDIRSGRWASARIVQTFNWKNDIWPAGSTLASYEDGEADQSFMELKQALASCRSYEGEGYAGKFKATVAVEAAPPVGDEAVSFREIIPMGRENPGDRDEQFIVVRVGNTIVEFTMLNVGGSSSFPTELVSRQVDRLRNAQRP